MFKKIFNTGLNQVSTRIGFFVVENVGIVFLTKMNIVMEAQESHK